MEMGAYQASTGATFISKAGSHLLFVDRRLFPVGIGFEFDFR
jgi:hypothetical protein